MSPKAHEEGGYRFSFYSDDHDPPHVHALKDGHMAKVELASGEVIRNYGFKEHELTEIKKIVHRNRSKIERKWHDHFSQ